MTGFPLRSAPRPTVRALSVALCLSVLGASRALVAAEESGPPDRFFDSGGVRIRYLEAGTGPPVVLIHGYTGTIERHWVAPGIFGDLAKDHRVIAFDCRGHGKSGKPMDPRNYGAEMGRDVVRLLDHLRIRRAHLVGYSMGAMIAGRLLTTDPDRFLTVTFIGHHPLRRWTAADQDQAEAAARELEGGTPFRSLILGISPRDRPPPTEDEIRSLSQRLASTNDVHALAAYHRALRALVVDEKELAASRVPTLAIIGSADSNLTDLKELQKVMPRMKTVVVEGATHGGDRGILRRPESLSALRQFLDEK